MICRVLATVPQSKLQNFEFASDHLIKTTTFMHEFTHKQMCRRGLVYTEDFLRAWDKSVRKNLDKDLCP